MGWRKQDVAETIIFVTVRYRQEMGKRVARARDARGMTNESLARASGLSVKTVSRLVNGKHEPREHTIKSVAKALGITPQEIRGTPAAPLGLGAREDQVDEIRDEFRPLVREIVAEVKRNRLEIDEQNKLIQRQEAILKRIEGALRLLPAVQRLLEAGAETVGGQPSELSGREGEEVPGVGEGRPRRAG